MLRRTYLGTAAATLTAATAGCLGGDDSTDTPGDTDEEATTDGTGTDDGGTATDGTGAGDATVTVASSDRYGEYLADADGMALYLFTNDEGTESTCYDDCAATWPPLTVEGDPTAGDGVSAELGTTERRDGATQVTAGGVPLYYYAGDESPGDTTGQGVGDVWFLLAPDGTTIEGDGSGTDGGGNDSGNSTDAGTTADGNGDEGGGGGGGGDSDDPYPY